MFSNAYFRKVGVPNSSLVASIMDDSFNLTSSQRVEEKTTQPQNLRWEMPFSGIVASNYTKYRMV